MKPNLFVGNYNQRIKENIKRIKKLPKIKGIKEILYPGENKYNRYQINVKKGILIPKNILRDIKELLK
jgi:LDH2 family malate/lactate/ureidoglycolate dehydrogenase